MQLRRSHDDHQIAGICGGLAEKSPAFKKTYEAWKSFRDGENGWFRLSEASFAALAASRPAPPPATQKK